MEGAVLIQLRPIFLTKEEAARFLSISVSTFEGLVSKKILPQPREISGRRVGWLLEELEDWAKSRPVSSFLPPPDSGYGRAGKPESRV